MAANKLGNFIAWVLTPLAILLSKLGFGPPPAQFEPPNNSNANDKPGLKPKDY